MKERGRRAALVAMALAASCILWAAAVHHRRIADAFVRWRIGRELASLLDKAGACEEMDGPAIEGILRPAADALAKMGERAVPVLADRLARGDPPDPWKRKWILYVLAGAVPRPTSTSARAGRPPLVQIGSDVQCTSSFSAHYGKCLDEAYAFPDDLPRLPAEEIPSPGGAWKATFRQTDPQRVPYDQETAAIDFEKADGKTRHLLLKDFRGIKLYWLTDRLVFLDSDLGHVAGALQLYDVEEGRWLYQMGEQFF